MIKAVFLDFDGTLFSHLTNEIPDSTVEAISKLKENGILVFLCTGRALSEIIWFDLKGIEFDGRILNNGQLVVDNKGEIIFECPIEGELKAGILKLFNEKKISMYLATENGLYINFVNAACIKCQNAVNSSIPPLGSYKGEKIYMASAFYDNEKTYDELIKLQYIADITQWTQGAVDIVPEGISKSTAIKQVIEKYDISLAQTLAIGDGENDIDMIEECDIGVAVGDAIDELKDRADYVTDDIDNDGVYNALKYFKLI